MFGIIILLIGVICGFLFPTFLIEAIRETDEKIANTAKKSAGITFAILTIIICALIILCNM